MHEGEIYPMKIVLRCVAFVVILAICVLTLLPGDSRPQLSSLPGQIEQATAYLGAAAVLSVAFSDGIAPSRIILLLTVYGAVLELCQLWVPGRHARLLDIGADFLGALIGVLIVGMLRWVVTRRVRLN
jgi:VanZ family protein